MFAKHAGAAFLVAAFAATLSTSAHALLFRLGEVPPAVTHIVVNDIPAATTGSPWPPVGPRFRDTYLFTIPDGATYNFSLFATTGYATRYGIYDFGGELTLDGQTLARGVAQRRMDPLPADDLLLDPVFLGEGDYRFDITGIGYAYGPQTTHYHVDFAFEPAAAEVPEPPALALVGIGILLCVATWRDKPRSVHRVT